MSPMLSVLSIVAIGKVVINKVIVCIVAVSTKCLPVKCFLTKSCGAVEKAAFTVVNGPY